MDVEDGELLRETAREALSSARSFTLRQAADLGWTGLLTPEAHGGQGWHPAEAAVIAFETGRAASPSCWATAAVAAAVVAAAAAAGLAETAADLLAGVTTGAAGLGGEPTTGFAGTVVAEGVPDFVTAFAAAGNRAFVFAADDPAVVLVEDGAGLDTVRHGFRLQLDGARPRVVDDPVIGRLRLAAQLLVSADTIGAVDGAADIVTAYLSERAAFGAPIASFQAVQHRLVDLRVFAAGADALARRAADALAVGDRDAERLVLATHAFTETRAVIAIDDCIQLAGGIGFTWEFPVHHLLRRAHTNASAFGTGRASRNRLATVGGW